MRKTVELNEPSRRAQETASLRQHLINASNELYLFELLSTQQGREVPPALKRAHKTIRLELGRLDAGDC